MRWLIMSHLIKIYAVFKFSYFHLWDLKSKETGEHMNSVKTQNLHYSLVDSSGPIASWCRP